MNQKAWPERLRPLAMGIGLALVACGSPDHPPDGETVTTEDAPGSVAEAPEPQEASYREISVADGGTIRGVVRLVGAPPPPRVVPVREDAAECGTTRSVEPVRVGPGGGIGNSVVSLADIREGGPLSSLPERVVIDQEACEFRPAVQVVRNDGTVAFTNSDPMSHNIRATAFENRPVNRVQPRGAPAVELQFPIPERVQIRCDMHPWMEAMAVVVEHPYYSVTLPDGEFVLSDVPPGSHTIEVWHEALGTVTRTVHVVAGETTVVDLEMSVP
jgi:plastocyanin